MLLPAHLHSNTIELQSYRNNEIQGTFYNFVISEVNKFFTRLGNILYVRTSLVRKPGTVKLRSSYLELVLTNIICIEKTSKGTEIVFVLTVFVLTKFYCNFVTSLCSLCPITGVYV